jgi:hypothetical protein
MHTWFECKVKYVKTGEDGKEKKISETYLIDAISYTEAEARIHAELETFIQGAFIISALKKSNIIEIVPSNDENDDKWYKGKVAILDADELTGKEKRINQYSLIAAKDINTALAYLDKSFSTYIVPFEIAAISDTTIMDVYPYIKKENEDIPDNLKSLSDLEINNDDFE